MAMNEDDQKKIKRNILVIKDRIYDLGPIIDRLIQRDIFTFEIQEEIENVQPSTRQNKIDRFIRLLCRTGPNAYYHFIDALYDTGYADLVGIMETDNAFHRSCAGDAGSVVVMKQQDLQDMLTTVMNAALQKNNKELISKFDKKVIDVRNEYDEKANELQKQLRRLEDIEKEYERLRTLQEGLRDEMMKKDDRIKRLHKANADALMEVMKVKGQKDATIGDLKQEMEEMKTSFQTRYTTLKKEIEEERKKAVPNEGRNSGKRQYAEKLKTIDSEADRLKKSFHTPTVPVLPPVSPSKVLLSSPPQMSHKTARNKKFKPLPKWS